MSPVEEERKILLYVERFLADQPTRAKNHLKRSQRRINELAEWKHPGAAEIKQQWEKLWKQHTS